MRETITLAIWITINTVGLGFSIWNIYDSKRDYYAASLLSNGHRETNMLSASWSLESEKVRGLQLLLLLLVGLGSLVTPDRPQPDPTPIEDTLLILFIFFDLALMFNTIRSWVWRKRIMRAGAEEI